MEGSISMGILESASVPDSWWFWRAAEEEEDHPKARESKLAAKRVNIEENCEKIINLSDDSLLSLYIEDLHNRSYEDQDQMPNPTLVTIEEQ